MAKSKSAKSKTQHEDPKPIKKMPSWFGSHTSMKTENNDLACNDDNFVILEDNFGYYATEKKRLDLQLADPNRYASPEYKVKLLKKLTGCDFTIQDDVILMV